MFIFETTRAFAQGGALLPGGVSSILQSPLAMLFFIFIIFYFLLIRPQQKKQRQHQEMLGNLSKGDKVISNGGIYGTIIALDEKSITLQVDDKVRIKLSRSAVAGLRTDE